MAKALCRHFGPCGGCDWQDRLYAEQLSHKRARLTDLLHGVLGPRAPDVQPMIGMHVDETGWPWRFRHKASFVFGQGSDGRTTIGHYAARSNDVVAITECPVHADRANRLAFALHEHLMRARVPAAGPSLTGVLRHLIVRIDEDQVKAERARTKRTDESRRRRIARGLPPDRQPGEGPQQDDQEDGNDFDGVEAEA